MPRHQSQIPAPDEGKGAAQPLCDPTPSRDSGACASDTGPGMAR